MYEDLYMKNHLLRIICGTICAFFFIALPLFPQDFYEDDDDYFDDFLFEDDTGITVVGIPETSQQMAVISR